MDFFKTVFSENPDPPNSESPKNPPNNDQREDVDLDSAGAGGGAGGGWSFGGLMKTLATKSESVIETYRRDLQEFGSGLKKEIEVAQGSLGTVGNAIDEFGNTVLKGTAQIISQGKDAILADDLESDSSDSNNNGQKQSLNSKRYSRFDAQVHAIQADASTYSEDPEDLDDYNKWKLGFDLGEKSEEIEGLLEENGTIEIFYQKVVPDSVDHTTFWCRYFYKIHKLRQAEDLRANLVKRAISREEEEELSWDVDDEEEEEEEEKDEGGAKSKLITAAKNAELGVAKEELQSNDSEKKIVEEANSTEELRGESSLGVDEKGDKSSNVDDNENKKGGGGEESIPERSLEGDSEKKSVLKSDEKVASEGKVEPDESHKDSDVKVASSQASVPEEEDLGWDEIEDLSSIDEKKVTHSGSPNRAELRKRLSAAEEEEDLSWDIEDDDDDKPTKA